jgi:hypothetical protein
MLIDYKKTYIVTIHLVVGGVEIVTTMGMQGREVESLYRAWRDGWDAKDVFYGHSRWADTPVPVQVGLVPNQIALIEFEEATEKTSGATND